MALKNLLFLAVLLPMSLLAQQEQPVSATYLYYPPLNVSREQARNIAIERARVQALADAFGTLVESYDASVTSTVNGKSDSRHYNFGESTVKGEWLADTKDPVITERLEDDMLQVEAQVWGLAREIVSTPIDIHAVVLKNGLTERHADHFFHEGDQLYLSFRSPSKGYLSVYLMDDDGTVSCMLPYKDDDDGVFRVKGNKDYLLFSERHAEKGEPCDEYVLTCDRQGREQNLLYVIFSPNKFVKANDCEPSARVKVDDEMLNQPRSLSFEDFERWLLRCRRTDHRMQVIVNPLTIEK
ncbi:MAG: DUF4384 domain-containing protein [Bacteroidales bacterium]|nr:DUF4384 domain-containing protein [Bacteroidales bacterium]